MREKCPWKQWKDSQLKNDFQNLFVSSPLDWAKRKKSFCNFITHDVKIKFDNINLDQVHKEFHYCIPLKYKQFVINQTALLDLLQFIFHSIDRNSHPQSQYG